MTNQQKQFKERLDSLILLKALLIKDNEFDEVDYRIRDVKQWSDIAMISAGNGFVVGLKSNGELVAVGDNSEGQCDVSQLNR